MEVNVLSILGLVLTCGLFNFNFCHKHIFKIGGILIIVLGLVYN
jgi:hypothetical protein